MNDEDKFFYFIVGYIFCLFMLAVAALIVYDQIDMKIIIVIARNNLTSPKIGPTPV